MTLHQLIEDTLQRAPVQGIARMVGRRGCASINFHCEPHIAMSSHLGEAGLAGQGRIETSLVPEEKRVGSENDLQISGAGRKSRK